MVANFTVTVKFKATEIEIGQNVQMKFTPKAADHKTDFFAIEKSSHPKKLREWALLFL